HFFDTLLLDTGAHTAPIMKAAKAASINARVVSGSQLALSLDETATVADVEALLAGFASGAGASWSAAPDRKLPGAHGIPAALLRQSPILSHPIFSRVRSETDMLRYLRGLADKDLALDRTMIPLGSCTMKLNATAEMIPITWPEFGNMHPYAPVDQAQGYKE